MGITQQIGASSLIKPGVIDNTAARPASPYEGQVIYQKDTDAVLVWNGTAWYPNWNTAWGSVGYATNTSLLQSFTTVVDITGLTVTFTGVAGRLYRVDGWSLMQSNVHNDAVNLMIKNSAGTVLQQSIFHLPSFSAAYMASASIVTTATGSTTFKISAQRQLGTGTIVANGAATYPASIVVTDIGPA